VNLNKNDYAILEGNKKYYYVFIESIEISQYMDEYIVQWVDIDPTTKRIIGTFQNFFSNINVVLVNPTEEEIYKFMI